MLEGQLTWSVKDPRAKFMGSADATPMHPYFLIDISKFDHWNAETQTILSGDVSHLLANAQLLSVAAANHGRVLFVLNAETSLASDSVLEI